MYFYVIDMELLKLFYKIFTKIDFFGKWEEFSVWGEGMEEIIVNYDKLLHKNRHIR